MSAINTLDTVPIPPPPMPATKRAMTNMGKDVAHPQKKVPTVKRMMACKYAVRRPKRSLRRPYRGVNVTLLHR